MADSPLHVIKDQVREAIHARSKTIPNGHVADDCHRNAPTDGTGKLEKAGYGPWTERISGTALLALGLFLVWKA